MPERTWPCINQTLSAMRHKRPNYVSMAGAGVAHVQHKKYRVYASDSEAKVILYSYSCGAGIIILAHASIPLSQ